MPLTEYLAGLKGKRISVIGLGVSNLPLIRLMLDAGLHVTGRDRKSADLFGRDLDALREKGLELRLGPEYLGDLDEDIIFRTPGISPNTPELVAAKLRGSTITSEMEVFFQLCPCPIIGITGSDGKTTTTTLTAELLKSAGHTVHLGGNIGTPLLSSIPKMSGEHYAVLELSSFQLMTIENSPRIAVVTNITPNHLDYHRDMEEYITAKKNIFIHQDSSSLLVLNMDNDIVRGFGASAPGKVRHFSLRSRPAGGFYLRDGIITLVEDGTETPVIEKSGVALMGMHNVENLMAAFAAVYDIVGLDICRRVAESFSGVEHRLEMVRKVGGVLFYNDSIASTPARTIAGLKSFDKKVILIAGGYDKNIPYDELGPVIREKVKLLVLTGATASRIEAAVTNAGGKDPLPEIIYEPDFEIAVLAAAARAKPGDTVLLSPASASFDRFRDFAERGSFFREIVSRL